MITPPEPVCAALLRPTPSVLATLVLAAPLLAQGGVSLTNLATVGPGIGLPAGWELRTTRSAPAPLFAVTADCALRVEAARAAGFALFPLGERLAPTRGALSWRWRTGTPIAGADLQDRARDDSPARVIVAFAGGRTLFYSWGGRDTTGTMFRSWTGSTRGVVILRSAEDATGAWRFESRDPFADYRGMFDRDPPAIRAVGVSADTEQLTAATWAEVADLTWWSGAAPSASTPGPCGQAPLHTGGHR